MRSAATPQCQLGFARSKEKTVPPALRQKLYAVACLPSILFEAQWQPGVHICHSDPRTLAKTTGNPRCSASLRNFFLMQRMSINTGNDCNDRKHGQTETKVFFRLFEIHDRHPFTNLSFRNSPQQT